MISGKSTMDSSDSRAACPCDSAPSSEPSEQGQRPAVPERLPEEHDGRRKEEELCRQDDAQARRRLAEQHGLDRRGQEQQPGPRTVGLFEPVQHIKG